jgi:hypothetical protein
VGKRKDERRTEEGNGRVTRRETEEAEEGWKRNLQFLGTDYLSFGDSELPIPASEDVFYASANTGGIPGWNLWAASRPHLFEILFRSGPHNVFW